MKAFQRDFFREIGKNRGRFLSVLFIVMLGAAFFSGIRSSKNDMYRSADRYYDRTDFMDIRVVSTQGLTEEDLEDMRNTEGVEKVVGGYSAEVLNEQEDTEMALKVIGLTDEINQITVTDGRLPQKSDECLADDLYLQQTGCSIGDQITVRSGTSDPLSDTLKEDTYTIVGSGTLPYYMEMDRGSGSVGDGSIDAFVVVLPEVFEKQDVYTEACIQVEGAAALDSFSQEYQSKVSEVEERLEEIAGDACDRRYQTLYQEGAQALDDARQEVDDAEQELADAQSQITDGEQQLADARTEITDGEQELADGEKEIADRERELADAKQQLEEKKNELNAGKQEIASGEQQIAQAGEVLASKEQELNSQRGLVESKEKELNEGKAQLEEQAAALEENRAALEAKADDLEEAKAQTGAKAAELEAAKTQLESAEAMLAQKKAELESARQQIGQTRAGIENNRPGYDAAKEAYGQISGQLEDLSVQMAQADEAILQMEQELAAAGEESSPEYEALLEQKAQMEQQSSELNGQMETLGQQISDFESGEKEVQEREAQLQAGEQELAESEQQLETQRQQITDGEAQLAQAQEQITAGEQQISAGRQQLEAGEAQLEAARSQTSTGEQEIADAWALITSGEEQIRQGKAELDQKSSLLEQSKAQMNSGESQIRDAGNQITDGEAQLEDAKKTLEDARRELEEGKAELTEKEQELADAKKEYEEAYREAQPELEDARQEIADGEKQLNELEMPEWYVTDRDDITSAKGFADDAERVSKVGEVFPLIFFLVAALVSLTTMTRMVEEQRQQIGTLKALGYRDGAIAVKYFSYAMLATVTGAVAGVLIGEKLFPWVIMNAYGMLYLGLPEYLTPLNYEQGILAVGASMICTGAATLLACKRELRAKPSDLMRPEPPKNGKRVLLERVSILWKHLKFTQKSTIRNLFRYKKRFFMTVIGIGGCMGLILVGFGLQDSITAIAKNQFTDLFTYQAAVTVQTDSEEEREAVMETAQTSEGMGRTMEVYAQNVKLQAGNKSMDAILEVPKEPDNADQFFTFRDRVSGESYEFPSDGIAISEKTAKMLGVSPGDTILAGEENEQGHEVKVSIVIENYVQHYIFIAPELYEQIWGKAPEYNQILMKYEDISDSYEAELGERMMEQDGVVGITFISDLEAEIDDMLEALNIVIIVLILSAGLLAFVVLYNLNNINITERKRELATLKVLGFYDMEVAEYVYRENVILTVFGILAGALIGKVLHQYIIQTVEVDMMMFGRSVFFRSYLFSALLTLVFSLIVNYIMYYRLRKIDMIESLKSVE